MIFHVALTVAVIMTVSATVSSMDALSVTSESTLMERPTGLSWVRVPNTATAAIILSHMSAYLIYLPAVFYEEDTTPSDLYSWRGRKI